MQRVTQALSKTYIHIRRQPAVFFNFFTFILSYFFLFTVSFISWIFFFLLNRTVIVGKENLRAEKNTLFLSNHQSMIDSFLIGTVISFPALFLRPTLIPWHPAAKENFFRNPIQSFFSRMWKCIAVRRGQHDFEALENMKNALTASTMLIYPEGSRSRSGEVGTGRPGTGKLIHDTGARCIPIYIEGMNDVLPIGRSFPRFFRKITVRIGHPVEFDNLLKEPSCKETSEKIIEKVMVEIRNLKNSEK
ncbi:1-acyl-sn-glycerol-3-phosphate acyltransferase [Myxococcota bacterium]|nr:1-acyl-sn-glycerol-3-phosphate acyltransferase [Myxococcota bacterium]MBU1380675.1 1-acyl-sn-glycerol-3-phosphate acyltransferase [Myxococcota bacterium]MBU1495883.1 1-acyl-sn-glycerol-3-phosphate acyltransferase [Myxococcota bacterium]